MHRYFLLLRFNWHVGDQLNAEYSQLPSVHRNTHFLQNIDERGAGGFQITKNQGDAMQYLIFMLFTASELGVLCWLSERISTQVALINWNMSGFCVSRPYTMVGD